MSEVERILQNVKETRTDYLRLKRELSGFLKTRLRARMKLQFDRSEIKSGKDKVKNIARKVDEAWDISWARVVHYDLEKDFREWLSKIGIEYLLYSLLKTKDKQAGNIFYKRYRTAIKSVIAHSLYGKRGTGYFSQRCEELTLRTFQRFDKYIHNYNPYKSGLYTYLQTIAQNLVRDEKARPENLVGEFNEQDEEQEGQTYWALSTEPSPDENEQGYKLEHYILESVIKNGGYPWQKLVVLLSKTLEDREDIVDHGGDKLKDLAELTRKELYVGSFHSNEEIDASFRYLERELEKSLSDIIPARDHRSRDNLSERLEEKTGDIKLEVFFGKNPRKNLSDWNHRVLKRIRKQAVEDGVLEL